MCGAGVFEKLHEHFHDTDELSALLLDSTIVRAHSCAAGAPKKNGGQDSEALGRSLCGFTTKFNATVNDPFVLLRFILTAGDRHDVTQVSPALIAGYTCEYVIADTAYDSDALRETIVAQGQLQLSILVRTVLKTVLMIKRCPSVATL